MKDSTYLASVVASCYDAASVRATMLVRAWAGRSDGVSARAAVRSRVLSLVYASAVQFVVGVVWRRVLRCILGEPPDGGTVRRPDEATVPVHGGDRRRDDEEDEERELLHSGGSFSLNLDLEPLTPCQWVSHDFIPAIWKMMK